eukprot:2587897-Pleurochrysis_carterae.AAC.1
MLRQAGVRADRRGRDETPPPSLCPPGRPNACCPRPVLRHQPPGGRLTPTNACTPSGPARPSRPRRTG